MEELNELDSTCGISDEELTQRFKESIRIDDEIRRIKGLPVARYDSETKKAYLEYPDGRNSTMKLPEVIVFAGPNGSGKTTITKMAKTVGEYINADDIKRTILCSESRRRTLLLKRFYQQNAICFFCKRQKNRAIS